MKLLSSSRLPEPDKHKYIALIELALEKGEFSADEAIATCGLSEKQFRFVSGSIFALSAYQSQAGFDTRENLEWVLKPEAYFSYLQYLEFRHAIETAKRAFWLSVMAIAIAILATIPAISTC